MQPCSTRSCAPSRPPPRAATSSRSRSRPRWAPASASTRPAHAESSRNQLTPIPLRREQLRTAQSLIVADYRGLSVKEIDALRTRLLEHGASFQVVKNTLTRRAAEAAGADAVLALLEGPTAIAFLESDGDPVAVAKALTDTARTTRVLAIRGGILDGQQIGEEDIRNLATLPPTDVLQAQLVGAIAGPLITIV